MGRRKREKRSSKRAGRPTVTAKRKRLFRVGLPLLLVTCLAAVACLILVTNGNSTATPRSSDPTEAQRQARSLDDLLAMTPEQLVDVDIAEMNLLCAKGLPGAEDLDIDKCLAMLDRWAQKVKVETERHLYRLTDPRYKDHAEHYKHSEARFRAEWLISVLQQDIGLHYHAGFVPQDVEVPPFKTSQETFLHGLMDNDDPHKAFGGNCVSLPVAYTAVGRRLGYPVKLVTSKEHVFCRWEGLDSLNPAWRDRFNFDGAGNGFSIDPDEFYLTWPRKSTPEQVGAAGWLKSLTPAQELALFIGTRGHVLVCVRKDYAKARGAYAHAVRLWPASRLPQMWLADAIAHVQPRRFRVEAASMMDDSPWPREVGANRNDQRPWYHTPQGRAANMAEVQRINEINRRKMERMRRLSAPRAPQTRTPYPVQRQQPGVRQPYQPPR